jgi:hypothetical protein
LIKWLVGWLNDKRIAASNCLAAVLFVHKERKLSDLSLTMKMETARSQPVLSRHKNQLIWNIQQTLPPETDEDLGTALATSGVDKLGDDDRKEVGMYSSSTGWLVAKRERVKNLESEDVLCLPFLP